MIVKQPIPGTFIVDGNKAALRLGDSQSTDHVFLTYALVTQGPEYQILPSVVLDDWGNEVGQIQLYAWIRDNGLKFPRAEVFGETPKGAPAQFFVRDLELFGKYPVYGFSAIDAPTASGMLLNAILVPDSTIQEPSLSEVPEDVVAPLREVQASWWRINPNQTELGFLG